MGACSGELRVMLQKAPHSTGMESPELSVEPLLFDTGLTNVGYKNPSIQI